MFDEDQKEGISICNCTWNLKGHQHKFTCHHMLHKFIIQHLHSPVSSSSQLLKFNPDQNLHPKYLTPKLQIWQGCEVSTIILQGIGCTVKYPTWLVGFPRLIDDTSRLQGHVLTNVIMCIWNPRVWENLKVASENTMQIEFEGFHHHNSEQQHGVDPSNAKSAEVQIDVA